LPIFPSLLAAASGENTPLNLPADAPRHLDAASGGSSSLVRTIVGLAIVIGVIYGVAWVLRQVKASRDTRDAGTGLSSAGVIALGPNRSLHLVRAGREIVLVGVAEHGVTPIKTYTEEEAYAVGLLDHPDDEPRSPGGSAPPSGGLVARLRSMTAR
jgi:flagellar protein FliO/FliZ